MPHVRYDAWIRQQRDKLASLAGQVVVGYRGDEMALVGTGFSDRPVFANSDADFIQLLSLHLILEGDSVAVLGLAQNGDSWSLALDLDRRPGDLLRHPDGIFRPANLEHLPLGTVQEVTSDLDALGNIATVVLTIGSVELALASGEVEEQVDGSAVLVFGDESVIVFRSTQMMRSLLTQGWRYHPSG